MQPIFGTLDHDGTPRRGRPPFPDAKRLGAQKNIRFSSAGLQDVCLAASRVGLTAAEFTRRAAIEQARNVLGRDA